MTIVYFIIKFYKIDILYSFSYKSCEGRLFFFFIKIAKLTTEFILKTKTEKNYLLISLPPRV